MIEGRRSRFAAPLAGPAALAGLALAPSGTSAQEPGLATVPPVPRDCRFEYACHEGTVQLRGHITSSRAQRQQQQQENTP